MNTLSDTGEGRARPSVWPVYVAKVVLVAVGTGLAHPGLEGLASYQLGTGANVLGRAGLQAALAVLGFVAIVGLAALRAWGWWCAVIFTAGLAVLGGWVLLSRIVLSSHRPDIAPSTEVIVIATVWLTAIVLLMWVLATRRRLFFPPKQARAE